MTMRRVFVGVAVVGAVALFAFVRPGAKQAHAQSQDQVTEVTDGSGSNGYDEAAHRYKNNQSRHWRQVALGTH
jgi:hypothetical protein